MTTSSGQLDAPNFTVGAANGITYGYRRFGRLAAGRPPLLLMAHFRGTIDSWDAAFIDTIAERREVILFDNSGVGRSSGTVPATITQMARDAIAFADALEVTEADLLGYSIGGMIAQEFTLLRPRTVRRLILAATGPQGSPHQMHGWKVDVAQTANAANHGPDDLLRLFFEMTTTSREQGSDYLARFLSRRRTRVPVPVLARIRAAHHDVPRRCQPLTRSERKPPWLTSTRSSSATSTSPPPTRARASAS
jgi:pimeloyl-ACP methyl ester carboxylesterase